MDLRLLVLQGKPQGKEIPIHVSPFLIGRGPECHLRPNSDMISRLHCALTIHGDEVRIRDLGSTNGTIVDGERLTDEFTLTDGDIFQVGPLVFQVVIRLGAPAAHSAAGPAAPARAPHPEAAAKPASPDDVVQWLVSDSKNEVPASGSGVYDGKTVFTTGPLEKIEKKSAPDPETPDKSALDQPATPAGAVQHHAVHKAGEPKPKGVEATGAAAQAAEDLIRKFVERRPHK